MTTLDAPPPPPPIIDAADFKTAGQGASGTCVTAKLKQHKQSHASFGMYPHWAMLTDVCGPLHEEGRLYGAGTTLPGRLNRGAFLCLRTVQWQCMLYGTLGSRSWLLGCFPAVWLLQPCRRQWTWHGLTTEICSDQPRHPPACKTCLSSHTESGTQSEC